MRQARNLLVEGWRFIPHSYAIVNAHQLLELRKSPLVRLRHRDMPFYLPSWSRAAGLLDPDDERAVADVPPPAAMEPPDAVYRIGFPYDFSVSGCPRTCVFATAEFGRVPDDFIAGARSLREALATTDAIIATPSRWSREGIIESGGDPGRVFVVPHGVDTGTFRPLPDDEREALRAQLGFSRFTLLSVGSMTKNKGLSALLKAFAAVAARHPDVRLALKGLDAMYPSREFLPREARTLTTAERERVQERLIYFGGTLSEREMASLYQASDLYVSPYLAEGFNLPVLEAAACGLPVVCTAGGPTDDFTAPEFARRVNSRRRWDEEMRGWILEPDPDHLVQQILSVLEDPSLCARAWSTGPQFARARFTWKHATDRLLAVLFPE